MEEPSPYARLHYSYVPVASIDQKIEAPDKQNASSFDMPMKMSDEDPDYAALTIAGMIFGGSPNSRLFERIRVKDASATAPLPDHHSHQG